MRFTNVLPKTIDEIFLSNFERKKCPKKCEKWPKMNFGVFSGIFAKKMSYKGVNLMTGSLRCRSYSVYIYIVVGSHS